MFLIHANLTIPLQFHSNDETKQKALDYFKSILRPEIIEQIELDIHTKEGKTHIVNATEGIRIEILDVQSDDDL